MSDRDWYDELADFLRKKGHTATEVERIVTHVRQYDAQTQHDSIMDSLEAGRFNLDDIIKEALAEPE